MPSPSNNNKDLMRYAGLAMQMFAGLAISLYIGYKLDKWIKLSFPVFAWVLPLLVLVGMIVMIIKDTSRKNDGK